MWTKKKQDRLLGSLFAERAKQQSNFSQYKYLSKFADMPNKSVKSEIRSLKRSVGRNRRTPYFYRKQYNIPAPTVAGDFKVLDIDSTEDFINSAGFADNVIGDKFTLKNLELKFQLNSDIDDFRVVVYSPKRVGNQWQPGLTLPAITAPIDPNIYSVLHDSYSNRSDNSSDRCLSRFVNLRNMTCIVNRDASPDSLEKADVKIKVFYQADTKVSPAYIGQLQTQLCITDK